MRKIKFLARSMLLFAAISSVDVNGEDYIVKPGDELSYIAEAKVLKSGLPLSREQVMLTIFKLNPDVFIEGDVDRVIAARSVYIPDNVADFVQLSKKEAQQSLSDKNYMRELYLTASKLKLASVSSQSGSAGNNKQDYAQIIQTLENHQQDIESLKIENAHLSKSLNLLERALGRIVILQGALTNDIVKVKSKLYNGS